MNKIMIIEDLQIGDWVENCGFIRKVDLTLFNKCFNNTFYDIIPIELSPKILEKIGFINGYLIDKKVLYYNYQDNTLALINIYYNNDTSINGEFKELFKLHCKYVHELQHILKMFNIDKQIIL